jgi:hypothetical protein
MVNKKYSYQNIKLSDLLLNSENPRFNPVKHQTEAICSMLEDQKEKLIALAKHIIEFGLNPTDITLVKPFEEKWLVLEGNRRVTSIKLLNDPDLISNNYKKIKSEFEKLNKKIGRSKIKAFYCVIDSDENTSNEWVRLKHTGQNEGAGIVNWDAQQTARFNTRLKGKPDVYIQFLDHIETLDFIPDDYKKNLHKIKKTNLVRLFSDPDVRNLLGILHENGILSFLDGVSDYFLGLLHDLIFNDISVGNIYHKNDRLQYIYNLKARVDKTNKTRQNTPNIEQQYEEQPNESNTKTENDKPVNELRPSNYGRGYPTKRNTLVPSNHHLIIDKPRIKKIFYELKSLDINNYPNAIAVLFRVFIEMSCDYYITSYFLKNVDIDSKLSQKIETIASHFESTSTMTKNELKIVRQMSSSQHQTNSINTFHAYVHNMNYTPIADNLKSSWDDLWPFIDKIWAK